MSYSKNINAFVPHKILLMGAAPSSIPENILQSISKPVLSHTDPLFIEMMHEIRHMIQYLFQTKNNFCVPLQGPASAAMDAMIINLIEPGDTVIVCENGMYGERFYDVLQLFGANAVRVHHEWGEVVDAKKVQEILEKTPNRPVVKVRFGSLC